MFAFILVPILFPLALLWGAGNGEFLEKVTDADWQYVGYTERSPGLQADGSYALTLEVEGESYILFKQRPAPETESVARLSD